MKKVFVLLSGILLPLATYAQEGPKVLYEEEMYALKISPNGEYVGNMASNAAIFEIATGEQNRYPETYLGGGNSIANNGMGVGTITDKPALFYQGKIIRPENYLSFWFGSFEGITPDGSIVVGYLNNTEKGVNYIPIIAYIDENGNVSDPTYLPYPHKDLFNGTPQFVSALWVSDDGKTVGGQVVDSMGYYVYPIVFQQDSNGEWSYYLPTEDLFNPTGIVIPENPWENEPEYPEPEKFMSGALLQAYQEAYQAFSSGQGKAPIPEEYMKDDEYEKYKEAVLAYNDWFYGEQTAVKEYTDIYNEVIGTSPTFALNDFALRPDGLIMAQLGGVVNETNRMEGKIYIFNTKDKTFEILNPPSANAAPKQILPDGTMFVAIPLDEDPNSWVLCPGETEFLTVPEFLQNKYPELAEYVSEKFANGSGIVSASYDMSVFMGGLFVTCRTDYHPDMVAPYYSSYIFTGLNFAGVESIVAEPQDGIYRVYNLQGVKVLETKDASLINNLGKGLYIINGKKILI